MTDTYRVLVVDDQDLYAKAVELVLGEEDGIEVVARAQNGLEAIELAAEHRPDLVVMDVEMPLMNGIDATRVIHDRRLARHVVMLTGSDVEAHSDTAHGAGATAFLSKGRTADELVKVIRHLMALQAA